MRPALLLAIGLLTISRPALAQDAPQVYKPGDGVTAPRLLREVKPFYSPEAMRAGTTGRVKLECVVRPDGTVTEIRVTESLSPVLDEEATRALKQWMFSPGLREGKAVPVLVEIEMTFSMARGPRLDSAAVFKPGPGVTSPKVIEEVKPQYSERAQAAGIQGNVGLECVVLADGTVGDVRVSMALDPDLDAEAIRTLRRWRFTPGEKDGRRVAVQVIIEMTFSLR
jgi:TonB family protein